MSKVQLAGTFHMVFSFAFRPCCVWPAQVWITLLC